MLTFNNCVDYLFQNYFTDAQFIKESNGNFYFTAIDEDDQLQEIEFEPNEYGILVSVKLPTEDKWIILEQLSNED